MMAITTSSSINVKPVRFLMLCLLCTEQRSATVPFLLHLRLQFRVPRQQLPGVGHSRQAVLQPGPLLVAVAGAQGLAEPGRLGVTIEEGRLHLVIRVDEETVSVLSRVGHPPD